MPPPQPPPASPPAPWAHPHVALPDVTAFAAAFLDLLLLASGPQPAWSPPSLRRALAWADHLRQIMAEVPTSGKGLESRRSLDTALANLTNSEKSFPAGLPRLTASDLSRARKLFLQALLQSVGPDSDYFDSIIDILLHQLDNDGQMGKQVKEEICARNSALTSVESLKRFVESSVGCLSLEEITSVGSMWDRRDPTTEVAAESLFKAWASNAMEYVTAYTTVYKVAAANLIFKSREEEWRRVLDTSRAHISSSTVGDNVASDTEISELCCLQLAYSDCRDLAFTMTSSSPKPATNLVRTSEKHEAVRIEAFLAEILERQVDLWWKLPPVLLAGVCATRFSLLKTYLQTLTSVEIANGNYCKCPCHESGKATCHLCQRCPTAHMERLWCFAVQHPLLGAFEARGVDNLCTFLLNEARQRSRPAL